MAENPATWGPLEHAIKAALEQHHQAQLDGRVGLSSVRLIADAVRGVQQAELRNALKRAHDDLRDAGNTIQLGGLIDVNAINDLADYVVEILQKDH